MKTGTRGAELIEQQLNDVTLRSLKEACYLLEFFLHFAGELARVILGLARSLRS